MHFFFHIRIIFIMGDKYRPEGFSPRVDTNQQYQVINDVFLKRDDVLSHLSSTGEAPEMRDD
jgi:hypothetical protein